MTDNNVAKLEPLPAPQTLIEQAITRGASIEVIERLLALQERWEMTQARKAFNNAIAEFKKNPPEILKTETVNFGSGKAAYNYEDLAKVMAVVDPALAAHGLWARFKVRSEPDGKVTVTCVIGHNDGYVEEGCTLSASPDTSGNKNHLQAIGSATAYLQRYTLKPALGLAAARDDDGRGGLVGKAIANAPLTAEQAVILNGILKDYPEIDVDKFLGLAGATSVETIMGIKYDSALACLNRQIPKIEAKRAKKDAKK